MGEVKCENCCTGQESWCMKTGYARQVSTHPWRVKNQGRRVQISLNLFFNIHCFLLSFLFRHSCLTVNSVLYNIRNSSFCYLVYSKLKREVTLFLCLIKHHVWGSGGIAPPFLISALEWGDWSAPRPCRFTSGETAPTYPLNIRLGGPQSRSERCGEEKNLLPLPRIERRPSNPSPYRLICDGTWVVTKQLQWRG
jgi:hypothetical protein